MSTAEPMTAYQTHGTSLPNEFEALYTNHYDFMWRCALRLGATTANVEDMVHEAFMIALRRYDPSGFEGPDAARPSTWLFAILHNVLRNWARSERRRQARLERVALEQAPPSMQTEVSLGVRLLDEFLDELEPERRVVFVLAELEGMRGPEIAQTLGVNANTVRSRLRAARQAFDDRFGDEAEVMVERASEVEAPAEARARGLVLLSLPMSPAASVAGLGALGWALGAVAGVLALIGVVAAGTGDSRARTVSSSEPIATVVDSRAVVEPSVEVIEPSEAPIVVEAPLPTTRAQRPRATTEPVDLEANARERLARARRALLDGDAAAALALVEGPDAWPATLDAHRVALEIGALCTLDRPQQARARAQAWRAAHPDGSSAISMHAACWDDNSPTDHGHRGL